MNFIRTLFGTFDQWSNQENVLERGKGYIDACYLYGHSFKRPKDERRRSDVHGESIGACLPKDEDSESKSTSDTSLIGRMRKTSDDIRREIILKYRRQKKQKKKQAKAEFYRNKYRTSDKASSPETGIAKETTTKHNGFSRLFHAIQTRITCRDENESRPARERVTLKLAQRRRVYEGCSREEIREDIRQKYFK